MNKQLLLSSGICGLVGFTSCHQYSKELEVPLNVIYILADDLGYGDMGCYGQQKIKTPHIDRMATEGILFTQHYAGCTVSAPSRCALMTGLHTGHTQIRRNQEVKPEGQQPMAAGTYTLGQLMQEAGYTTGIFGKWGLGAPGSESVPTKMGFGTFFGYNCQREAHSYYPDHLWHNEQRVDYPENKDYGRQTYSADIIHEQAKEFIRTNKAKPFFAMLTYTLPHAELNLPHDSIYRRYEHAFEEMSHDTPVGQGYYPSEKPCTSFAAMVSRLDLYVGEIMAELKELGIDQQTIVIFTSDNGPHHEGGANPDYFDSNGPFRGIKRDLYEGGIRVPMIAWCPGTIPTGVQSDHTSAFWDMMPTLAELTQTELKVETDGLSILPTLLGEKGQKQHDYLYWEFHEQGGKQAIRKGNWKLVRLFANQPDKTTVELYNLSSDPGEEVNLITQHPEHATEMGKLLELARAKDGLFPSSY